MTTGGFDAVSTNMGAEKCTTCAKTVYPAERLGVGGKVCGNTRHNTMPMHDAVSFAAVLLLVLMLMLL